MYVTNLKRYGYMPVPLDAGDKFEDDVSQLTGLIVDAISELFFFLCAYFNCLQS